ncbi:hypothetical protein NHL50_18535 [Acidimicrobiia bacterium EGI L10123]|uniref:hypothetical protein n=1 Tax=Salinilacustrithrix flava TaxID=2957203 RepID=UPI003D7C26AD|nr:hypothetical protein [Acidimicrobiia bacterium EGI L10123]
MALISPGVPGRCPACDGLGYIDSIDIGHRYQIQHCKDCAHRWEYLFDPDGTVVGLTELDDAGRPVARSRVRPLRAAPAAAEEPAEGDDEPDVILDLRDDAPAETAPAESDVVEPDGVDAPALEDDGGTAAGGEPGQLSPGEWLRRSVQR